MILDLDSHRRRFIDCTDNRNMATQSCETCGRPVRIAGGIGDLWSFETDPTGGMTIELDDGGEFFLCHDCIGQLPSDRVVTSDDINKL
jgi:hypothetical protein